MTAAHARSEKTLRVRFCPSPTGTPHVGLIRTALFNWAYARHVGGAFVFRLEDTDAERDSEESYLALLDALSWLGLNYDEGPDIGGPYAPYRQSERGEIYRDVLQRLLDTGEAYEAFSTPEEVEARHVAAGRNPKLGYDNFDRDLTDEQRAAFRATGASRCCGCGCPTRTSPGTTWSGVRPPSPRAPSLTSLSPAPAETRCTPGESG